MILNNLKPNYVTHPGEIIMDEIEYLQIRQKDFAERIGVSASLVNQILKGKRPVNTEVCRCPIVPCYRLQKEPSRIRTCLHRPLRCHIESA